MGTSFVRTYFQGNNLSLVRVILAVAFSTAIVISYPLWISTRNFPLIPVFSFFPQIPPPIDLLLLVCLLAALFSQAVIPSRAIVSTRIAVILALILAIVDQSRWTPWFYQYVLMMLALSVVDDRENTNKSVIHILRWVIIAMYFWSGIFKLNTVFYQQVLPMMYEPLFGTSASSILTEAGPLLAMLEAGIGIGLHFKPSRKVAWVAAILMHSSIIASLGPLGYNINAVILPWNLAMPLFIYVLFIYQSDFRPREIVKPKGVINTFIFVLVGFFPALNTLDVWDTYLSFSLYSGSTNEVTYYVNSDGYRRLPDAIKPYTVPAEDSMYRIDILRWCDGVTNASLNPEPRVFKRIAEYISSSFVGNEKLFMIIHERQTAFSYKPSSTTIYP